MEVIGQDRTFPRPRARAATRAVPSLAEFAYVALAFSYITGCYLSLFTSLTPGAGSYDDRQAGTPLMQAVAIALYAPALLLMLRNLDDVIRCVRRGWAVWLLIGLAVISPVWSVEPMVSFRRAAALFLTMAFTTYVASTFTMRQFLRIAAIVFCAIILMNALAALVPGWGIEHRASYDGVVRGVFPEKNIMGRFTGLALIGLQAFLMSEGLRSRLARVAAPTILIGVVLLVLSNARTPLLCWVGANVAMYGVSFIYTPGRIGARMTAGLRTFLVAVAATIAIVVLPAVLTTIVVLLGRNLTLTGRLHLWEYAVSIGVHRPVLGAGFGAFWTDSLTFNLRELHAHWETEGAITKNLTANAHNGYLDAWLELGFVGLGLLLLTMAALLRLGLSALRRHHARIYLWPIGVLAFMAVYYLTNSGVMDHSEIGWFLIAYAYLALAADRRETPLLANHRPRPLSSLPFRPQHA